jgi:hypothetical protein
MRVQGYPVSMWLLDAPGALPDIASWLSARQPALRDLWVLPGAILLAGTADGMHWAARLSEVEGGRVRGAVSALHTEEHAPSAPAFSGWRLAGGKLHFEFQSRDEGALVVEQIWTHELPPAALRKWIFGQLLAAGWRPADPQGMALDEAVAQGAAPYRWSRGRMTLSATLVALDAGSGITAIVRIEA